MTLGRIIRWLLLGISLLVACSDDDAPEPVGIMWGSGASGAFVEDTIILSAFFRDAARDPIGHPRPAVSWTSSNPAVLSIVSESIAVARDTGSVTISAAMQAGPPYTLEVPFQVVPRWSGRLVWSRQPRPGEQPAVALQHYPGHVVAQIDGVGFPGAGSGDASISWDGLRAAATATRMIASGAPVTIFVVDLPSGTVTAPFDALPGDQFGSAWFPGDTLLGFIARSSTGWDVFTGRPDGSNVSQRTTLRQSSPPFFDVSPDGTLVLALRDTQSSDLFEITLAGDTVRRLTATAEYNKGGAAVSPDGAFIAYSASRVNDDFTHVWVMSRDGSAARRLLPTARTLQGLGPPFFVYDATDSSPTWSPDSRWVLLRWTVDLLLRPDRRAYENLGELYAIRLADGLAVRLTRSLTLDSQPAFR